MGAMESKIIVGEGAKDYGPYPLPHHPLPQSLVGVIFAGEAGTESPAFPAP
jgi:hypothetical protein